MGYVRPKIDPILGTYDIATDTVDTGMQAGEGVTETLALSSTSDGGWMTNSDMLRNNNTSNLKASFLLFLAPQGEFRIFYILGWEREAERDGRSTSLLSLIAVSW